MINVTESTIQKLSEIMSESEESPEALRIFIQGGGCAGFSYGFAFDSKEEDDYIYEQNDIKIVIDPASMEYLQGATIDYKEDFTGASFTIENPNAQSSCGCGTSFAPKPCENN